MGEFVESARSLLAILDEYLSASERLCEVDLLNTPDDDLEFAIDDVEGILLEREELGDTVGEAESALVRSIAGMSKSDRDLIRRIFGGENAACDTAVGEVIGKLLLIQREILQKDKIVIERLKVKSDEVTARLKTLQSDKKKLNFLNVSAIEEQDGGFMI
jgi:hypothetical protein